MTNTSCFKVFKSELTNNKDFRVLGTSDEPYFVARDIAEFLEYTNTTKAVRDHIDDEDKLTAKQFDKNRENNLTPLKLQGNTILINESGLYSLIIRSNKPIAKKFKRWVTSEVLPSIRQSGKYKIHKELLESERVLSNTVNELKNVKIKNEKLLKRQKRDKYDKGNCCYVLTHEAFEGFYKQPYFKIGKATQTSNEQPSAFMKRLSTYNTCAPTNYKVHYVLYTENNSMLENLIKIKFMNNLDPANKEWVKGVKVDRIISFMKEVCELCCMAYREFPEIEEWDDEREYELNMLVQMLQAYQNELTDNQKRNIQKNNSSLIDEFSTFVFH